MLCTDPRGEAKARCTHCCDREHALRARQIALVSAENPSGARVFRDLVADPPASVAEFRNLWKLYILSLVARHLREQRAGNAAPKKLVRVMEQAGLISREASLRGILRSVVDYIAQSDLLRGWKAWG